MVDGWIDGCWHRCVDPSVAIVGLVRGWMNGQTDRHMDGWVGGGMDGRMDGQVDGRVAVWLAPAEGSLGRLVHARLNE